MLEAAAKLGDYLVVGLNSDSSVRQIKGPRRPINTEKDRKRLLEGLRCVNNVHIFDESNAARFLEVAKPHYYIKSADYSLETMNKQERDVLFKMGTVIRFVPLVEGKSTTQTISCLKS
jgi:rfaE bifunctional protein nucleotidyltransferase chain/domain